MTPNSRALLTAESAGAYFYYFYTDMLASVPLLFLQKTQRPIGLTGLRFSRTLSIHRYDAQTNENGGE